ncbi:MAG: cupredoxin domain-containing protein, partial [Firmicutes bacterium]|nr:cupredoxin domain-containing protein [Bacillota bacterium]
VQFQPKNYTVKAGTTVTFVNQDKVEHNVNVGEPGAEPEIKGPTVEMGAKWDLTFDKPGTYKIFCTTGDHWRLGMVGTVTVE